MCTYRWFSEYFKYFPIYYNKVTFQQKVELFEKLKDLERKNNGKDLKVLEIGVGPGANLQFYPENTKLTVVDPNRYFEPTLLKNLEKVIKINTLIVITTLLI